MKRMLIIAAMAARIIGFASCNIGSSRIADSSPPALLKKPLTDEYHGVTVTEVYRWLENFGDPAVKRWVEEQNQYSRAYFDKLPMRSAVLSRLKELHQRSASYFG